jgi:hypothetical protein
MAQSMDIAKLPFTIEYFLRPFSGETERFREWAKKFDYLCNMIIVFAIFGA